MSKDKKQEAVVEEKREDKLEVLKKVREEEHKVFSALKDEDYQALMSDVYTELDSYVDMCVKDISTGCLIEGAGGTGKTYRIVNKCLKSDVEFAYTDSFTTPKAFYIWLYQNRDKDVLIIDDVAGFMNNDKILAFLKGALWAVNNKRIVTYMTSSPIKDEFGDVLPNVCEVTANLVIITNFVNKKSPHVGAVLSRINYCKLEIPREELLRILRQIVKNEYDALSLDEREEVLQYLVDNTSDSTMDLNLRTLFKLYQFRVYSKQCFKPELWKNLALKMLQKDDRLVLVENLMRDENMKSEEERIKKFSELTGESKSTYYRLKKEIEKKREGR